MTGHSKMLNIQDLQVEFNIGTQRITAVRGVHLTVGEHETVVLAGESGSGKTVTAMSITRILPANARVVSGSISFRGKDLLPVDERELTALRGREIAYVFQEPVAYLNPVYTIGNQIAEVLIVHRGMDRRSAYKEVCRLLDAVEISDPARVTRAYPHELSGGMNQRAFLAMALACKPQLLIADEPTTALDVTIEARMLVLLGKLQKEYGFSLLFITHNLAVARRIADRVVVMYGGRVVEEGSCDRIFTQPRHEHTRELIAAYEKIGALPC